MSSTLKKCRVCGKEYEACRSANRGDSVFRWREVACSPECGAIYLNQINESRNHASAPKKAKHKMDLAPVIVVTEPVVEVAVKTQPEPEDGTPVVEE